MKKPLDQKIAFPSMCQTCGKEGNKTGNKYCSKFCQRRFVFMFYDENGKQCFTKTNEQIKKLLMKK